MPGPDKAKNKGGRPRRVAKRKITTIALEEWKFKSLDQTAKRIESSVSGLVRIAVDAMYFPQTTMTASSGPEEPIKEL